jgi:hypothetical protein
MTQAVFAGLLAIVASFAAEPGFLPRGVVIFLVFAVPALVGWLGVVRSRPALLIGAGLTSFVGAFIAFSGVTLILLIPALLFVFGAVHVQGSSPAGGRESTASGIVRTGAAIAIVVMLVGAGGSALLITDEGCWADYRDSGGRVEPFPYTTGEISVPPAATSVGCSTGIISPRGVGLAVLLWAGALLLAERSSSRRNGPYVSGSGTHWPSATPTATNNG